MRRREDEQYEERTFEVGEGVIVAKVRSEEWGFHIVELYVKWGQIYLPIAKDQIEESTWQAIWDRIPAFFGGRVLETNL